MPGSAQSADGIPEEPDVFAISLFLCHQNRESLKEITSPFDFYGIYLIKFIDIYLLSFYLKKLNKLCKEIFILNVADFTENNKFLKNINAPWCKRVVSMQ